MSLIAICVFTGLFWELGQYVSEQNDRIRKIEKDMRTLMEDRNKDG